MAFVDLVPPLFLPGGYRRWLVDDDYASGEQIKEMLPASGNRRIEFPSWEYDSAGCEHGMFDFNFASTQPSSGKAGMNHAKNALTYRSLSQGQQGDFIDRGGRSLRTRIELANGLNLVAKKLNSQRPIGFRRIDVENTAAKRELTGHIHRIG